MKQALSLYELNHLVHDVIAIQLPDSIWVQAELSEYRENNGHCFMELIEKDNHLNSPIAKASAKCWRNRWVYIRAGFERITGMHLRAGMKIMLQVHAEFHENYGFSWMIDDIDPTFTLGDMARKRLEIIQVLKDEGVFDLQKQLAIPMFCQRIAVISSVHAAGYGDFCHQMQNNEYGLSFNIELFPAVMQGEQIEKSVIGALNLINERYEEFDVVVIIRGGGATSDMSGFDTLVLAENVANFPLPIITGIGHERDESVLDMISNTRVKTPTAAATFLIEYLAQVYNRVQNASDFIFSYVRERMTREKMRIQHLGGRIPLMFSLVKTSHLRKLDAIESKLNNQVGRLILQQFQYLDRLQMAMLPAIQRKLNKEQYRLQMIEQQVMLSDPTLLLKRGYSITLLNGKVVKDASCLHVGDEIITRVENGEIRSIVK